MAGAGYKLFNTGDVLTASQVNTYLQEQVVMVFASAAARTTALASVLAEGMVTYLKDTDSLEIYSGTAWVSYGSGDLTAITAGTGITVTSGTGPIPTVALTTPVSVANGGTGISSFGTGVATFLGTPSSANLAAALTDETGTGSAVFATSPTLVTPNLGTPSAATLTNATGLPIVAGTTGTLTETRGGTNQTTYATGDLLYASAANTLAKRTIGSTGDVLTVSGGVPTWSAPSSGGGLTLLSTTSLSGTSTSISISASSYINLLVVFKGVYGSVNNTVLSMRLNSDTGSNYNYVGWRRYPGNTSGDFEAGQNQTSQYMTSAGLGTSSGATSFTGSMDIYRCNDTSQINYEFRLMGYNDSSVGSFQHTQGKYMASAAITNLTILNVVNSNTLSGTVYVYGVK